MKENPLSHSDMLARDVIGISKFQNVRAGRVTSLYRGRNGGQQSELDFPKATQNKDQSRTHIWFRVSSLIKQTMKASLEEHERASPKHKWSNQSNHQIKMTSCSQCHH